MFVAVKYCQWKDLHLPLVLVLGSWSVDCRSDLVSTYHHCMSSCSCLFAKPTIQIRIVGSSSHDRSKNVNWWLVFRYVKLFDWLSRQQLIVFIVYIDCIYLFIVCISNFNFLMISSYDLVYMLGQNIDSVIYQELIQDLAQKTDRDSKKDMSSGYWTSL